MGVIRGGKACGVRVAEQRCDFCVWVEGLGAGEGGDMVLWLSRTVLGGVSGGKLMQLSSTMRDGVVSLCRRRTGSSGVRAVESLSGWGEKAVAGPTRCRSRLGLRSG